MVPLQYAADLENRGVKSHDEEADTFSRLFSSTFYPVGSSVEADGPEATEEL